MARRTRREMIRTLAHRAFIGRVDVLQSFRANVSADEPTRMLFAISGEGGVGKTSLLDQLQRVGDDLDVPVLVIRCDDRQLFPVEVIARAAGSFGEVVPKAAGLKNLTAQLDRYEKLRRDIEADHDAPDLVRMLVSPVVSGGVRMAMQVPGVGLAAGVVDADKVGGAAGELASYLRRRVRNENEVRLVREPERVLTPLFLEVVNGLGAAGHRVVLFCDVFERTGGHLEQWLWQILRSDHGDFDPLFIVVVAGRDELSQAFTEFGDAAAFVQLQPFTERETELYLTQRDINEPELVRAIYRDTGGLPVLVELVASQRPQPGQPLPDVSGDAVERFLSWVDDSQRRTVCQHAAVPRWFDAELLALALNQAEATEQFDWLRREAFVRRPSSTIPGFHFHEKVRELMLRHLRHQHPRAVAEAHKRLADHFGKRIEALGLEPEDQWTDEAFTLFDIERAYHRTSSAPDRGSRIALEEYLTPFRWNRAHAHAVAWSSEQALTENDTELTRSTVATLAEAMKVSNKTEALAAVDKLDQLQLPAPARSDLTWIRWWATTDDDPTLLDQAIELDPNNAHAYRTRGDVRWGENRLDEAITDLTRAIELDPNNAYAYRARGGALREVGRNDGAIADFNRAIELDPNNAINYTARAEAHLAAGRGDDAMSDFNRAIELNPTWGYISRGTMYESAGRIDEAIADINRAIELDPNSDYAYWTRGMAYREAGRNDEAIADFNRAIKLDPQDAMNYRWRGTAYREAGRNDEAIADFNRAIELDPNNAINYRSRGEAHGLAGRYGEAIADLRRTRDLDPGNPSSTLLLAIVHLAADDNDGATAVFDELETAHHEYADAAGVLAAWQRSIGQPDKAVQTATKALELKVADTWDQLGRCLSLLVTGQIEDARTLAKHIVADDPEVMTWIDRADIFYDVRRLIAD